MRLVLLGAGGYHPNDHRQTACLMIPEVGVVLDAGTAAYRIAPRVVTERLDVFLTHAHLDHTVGLTYLLGLFGAEAEQRITVYGDNAKLEAVRAHLFAPPLFPVPPPFRMIPLTRPIDLPEGGRLTSFPLEHPGGATGFRLEWPGHSMAYVTDTVAAADANYVSEIRGVDLLVHEAYFADDQAEIARETGHSWPSEAARVAAAADAKRLVLVHTNPRCDCDEPHDLSAAREIFASTLFGADGMEIDF